MAAVLVGIAAVTLFDLDEEGVQVLGVLPQGFPALAFPASSWPTLGPCSAAPSGSPWSPWPTPPCCRSPWPPTATRRSTPTRSSGPSAPPTWPPASSRASPSPAAPPTPRWRWRPAPAPSSPPGRRRRHRPATGGGAGRPPHPPPADAGRDRHHRRRRPDRRARVRRLYRVRRSEFVLWLAAFLGVALLGVLRGIFVAILLSLADFVRRAWRPHDAVLGREDDLKGYHDIDRHPSARLIPGLLLHRFDAPLFFANAGHFRRRVHQLVA